MRSTNHSANTTTPPERNVAAAPDAAPHARSPRARRSPARSRRRGRREAGPAGFGGGLSSARDRRRVLERNEAERARVERALAEAPIQDGIAESLAPRPASIPASFPASMPASSMPASIPASTPVGAALHGATSHCPVCASTKLASDEVFTAGQVMRLVECLQCDHRFTARPRARWSDLGARMTRTSVAATA